MNRCQTVAALLACTVLLSRGPAALASGGEPTAEESAALAALKGAVRGTIVWESNRTGAWELYLMNADGTNARRLTSLAAPGDPLAYSSYLRPRFSPGGTMILFAYGRHHAPVEAWVIPAAGGEPRRLTAGNPLNWTPDGRSILLLRDKQIWRYDLATGQETPAHPYVIPSATDSASMVGQVLPDLSAGVFRFAKNEYVLFGEGKTVKTTGGCEPGLSSDGRYMYWVQGPKNFMVWDTQTGEERQLLGTPPVEPYNYTYFPTVTDDGHWLLYGASPSQHSHETSDYEVYLQELRGWTPIGQPVRLTFNSRTDRWPNMWLGRVEAGDGPYDVAGNRLTNPPPAPLTVFSFASDQAKPDWGGDWGMWPQVEGCGGETTWIAEDAQGGTGGSMRIDYAITADPRSFSMWFAPGRNVSLSGQDRFVIWAKGTVPSFTLVVKDRNSDPEGETEAGIADCVVTGVGEEWRCFELPFAGFRPREQDGRIDWGAINHVGVAMIDGINASSGSLQVDNLRAIPVE